ncbi:hypothetical protein [Pseudofrankia saprophytica]|uniref:hypothetical protein n=1 Tax=Pseudofrankia saprophytica TaxID=298655 RepID=UPI0018E94250|nr:hypothetical protein [Pseudofrankia saprophytica]
MIRRKSDALPDILGRDDAPRGEVGLPHDATVERGRDGTAPEAGRRGSQQGGTHQQKKTFFVPTGYRGRRVTAEFEGVDRGARLYLNGDFAAQCDYGYSNIFVHADRLVRHGEEESRWTRTPMRSTCR